MNASAERLQRARCSLEGLSVGDAFGERFFFHFEDVPRLQELVKSLNLPRDAGDAWDFTDQLMTLLIERRIVPDPVWHWTDDTQMALSIFALLRRKGRIDQDDLSRSFGEQYEPGRGYGAAMHGMLPRLKRGASWREEARQLFQGKGSFGNGSAMRVAPLGAYFADDLPTVVEQAARSAEVTHAHPEASAGAIAVAVGAALAWQRREAPPERPERPEFLDLILPHVPASEVRYGIERARDLPDGTTIDEAVLELGNGSGVSAQDTVPLVLWCAGEHLDSYEEALWLTVAGLGDRDTTCAMVGGIVAMSSGLGGIPAAWRQSREPLPGWPFAA